MSMYANEMYVALIVVLSVVNAIMMVDLSIKYKLLGKLATNLKGKIKMKKSLLFCVLIVVLLSISGCEGCRQQVSHLKSFTIGINREITLYSCDGKIIQKWETDQVNVEVKGSSARFIHNGKVINISGTFTIIEK